MRPICLIVQAFGPYAHKQVIDFRELKESTFFLIHGPTGSGKTSILDGIVFALYGDTSTRERQARYMRSDHAPAHILTEVAFDFSLGNDVYRIKRIPEQFRPKKKGGGMTKQEPSATLWSRNNLQNDADEGAVLASGYSEVTTKVEEILGFRSDQFRQVVILPQGQFRDFLLAGSGKREEILEILFKTGTYRYIQETLKEEAKIIRGKWEAVSERKNMLISESGAKSINDLDELKKNITKKITVIGKEIQLSRQGNTIAGENVKNGEAVLEKFQEKEEAETGLKELEVQRQVFHEKQDLLQKARKALPLKEVEKERNQRQKERDQADKRVSEIESALAIAAKEEVEAQKSMQEVEKQQPQLEELVKEIARIEQFHEKLIILKTASKELEEAEKLVKKAEDENERIKTQLAELEVENVKKNEILKQKQELAAHLTAREQSCEYALEQFNIRLELDDCKVEYVNTEKLVEQAKSKYVQVDNEVNVKKNDLEKIQKEWQQGQAAIIADQLNDGEPCPVCGSTIHPHPAISDVAIPSEKEITEKKKTLKEQEQTREILNDELNAKVQELNELRTKITMFVKQLKEAASVGMDILKESLKQKTKALEEAKDAVVEINKLQNELHTINDREKNLKKLLEKNGEEIKKVVQNKGSAENRVGDLKTSIPLELQSEEALISSLNYNHEEKKRLEKMIYNVKKRGDEASRKVAKYTGELKLAKETLESAQKSAINSNEQFAGLLEHAGFSSPDEYETVCLLEEEIIILDKQVQEYNAHCKAAKERCSRARMQVKDMTLPDIERLTRIYEETTRALENKIREEQDLDNEIKKITKLIADIKKIDKEIDTLDTRVQVLGYISDLANGKNRMRITFQRFVQTTLLDDVLIAASRRLSIMSKGRFLLRRITEGEDKRTSGGLNLEIDDAYTGKSRSVSTLSGGESFLAALSLALGLADVVQSYSGGVRLDTLFIDEGFGSLDSESLDSALRALIDLRKGGRLVAIISHVTELRERINTRLEIQLGKTGSMARFITE